MTRIVKKIENTSLKRLSGIFDKLKARNPKVGLKEFCEKSGEVPYQQLRQYRAQTAKNGTQIEYSRTYQKRAAHLHPGKSIRILEPPTSDNEAKLFEMIGRLVIKLMKGGEA